MYGKITVGARPRVVTTLTALLLFGAAFVALVHCGDDSEGGAANNADGDASANTDGSPSSSSNDGSADNDTAVIDEGPFTTWRLIRNPTTSVDQITALRTNASGSLAFILVTENDYVLEARRIRDGSRAWRVELPSLVDLHEWDNDVLVARSNPPVFERRAAADGSVTWSKPVPRAGIKRVDVNTLGIFALYGTATGLASDSAISVGRYDAQSGGTTWEKTTNPSDYLDGAGSLKATSHGVYIAGVARNGGPPYSTWYVEKRRADNGELAWGKRYTLAAVQSNNTATSIDSDDVAVYLAGYMHTLPSDPNVDDGGIAERTLIVKLDANTGDEIWHTTVPFGSNAAGYGREPSLVIDADSIYIADSNRGTNVTLAKLSKADGKPVWSTSSFPQANANGQIFVARVGAALLAGGRSHAPDGGSIDTQIHLEKREAATGNFSPTNHLELTE